MSITVFCCESARIAHRNGELVWSAGFGGWILTTNPPRSQTAGARRYAAHRGVDDCTGEPYVFDACPFCRHEPVILSRSSIGGA